MSCPPTKPAIAVITPNILIGLGLRTILEKVGPPGEIAVFDSFTEFIASGPERYFHYFAAMQVFMRHRTFFLENSHKTILLGKGYSAQFARMRQIDIFGGEERLVHDLLCLRSEAPRPDHALPRQHGTPAANLLSVRETEVLTLIAQGLHSDRRPAANRAHDRSLPPAQRHAEARRTVRRRTRHLRGQHGLRGRKRHPHSS